jgi:hypothetical protein
MMLLLFASLTLFSPIGAEIPDQVRDDVLWHSWMLYDTVCDDLIILIDYVDMD